MKDLTLGVPTNQIQPPPTLRVSLTHRERDYCEERNEFILGLDKPGTIASLEVCLTY
jgi:hypothetical protein